MIEGTMQQQRLAYNEMTVAGDGRVLTDANKRTERAKLGYCMECQGMPILLYHMKKSRLNPLWVTKEPRAVAGECAGGICFACHPDRDPANKGKPRYSNAYIRSPVPQDARRSIGAIGHRKIPVLPETTKRRVSAPPISPGVSPHGRMSAEIRPAEEASHAGPRSMSSPLPSQDQASARSNLLPPTSSSRGGSQSKIEPNLLASIPAPPIAVPSATSDTPDNDMQHSPVTRPFANDPLPREESNEFSRRSSDEVSASGRAISSASTASTRDRPSMSMPSEPMNEEDADAIISEVDSLVTALMGVEGTAEILAQSILGAMREHKSKEVVLIYCLRTIWESCKDNEDNKQHIMLLNGPEDIISTMKKFQQSPKLQEVGCGAVWALSICPQNRAKFIRLGACSVMMGAIEKYMASEDVLRPAVGAVRTLSPEREARELLKVVEGSKIVALAMKAHPFSDSIQRDGCAFLSNAAVDIENQFVHAVPPTELEAIVQAMENHKNDISVMAGACFALKNYTFEENNCRRLRRIKNSDALLKYAAGLQASPECMDDAGDILESMQIAKSLDDSIEDQACMSILDKVESQMASSDAPISILEFMKENDWSPRLTAHGLQLFRRIIVEEASHRDRLFDTGMIRQLVQYAGNLKDEEIVCQEACTLFAALAIEEHRRSALTGAGVCDIIFSSLKFDSNENLLSSSLEALQLLTSTNAGDCQSLARANKTLIRGVVEAHGSNEAIMMSGIGILSLVE